MQVRIEDDVIIWSEGNENLNSDLPRTVSEIEEFMAVARK
jgi:Xaa-Pro aminopeptidase